MKRTVAIISPSASIASVPLSDMEKIERAFSHAGYEMRFSDDLRTDSTNIEAKLDALHAAFADPSVDLIICAQGGFHAIGLIKQLDYELIRRHAKPFIGFSDITVLLNAIYTATGITTYYGPVFWSFNNSFNLHYTFQYLQKALNLRGSSYELEPAGSIIDYMDHQHITIRDGDYWVIDPGKAEGIVVGGHIPSLSLLQGTEYFPDLAEKILLLEMNELDGPWSLDIFSRCFTSLTYQKGFDQIAGILIGAFHSRCQISKDKLSDMIHKTMVRRDIPVIANCSFGHILPIQTLPIGGRIRIEAKEPAQARLFSE